MEQRLIDSVEHEQYAIGSTQYKRDKINSDVAVYFSASSFTVNGKADAAIWYYKLRSV